MKITNYSKTNYPNPLVLTIYRTISVTFFGETVSSFRADNLSLFSMAGCICDSKIIKITSRFSLCKDLLL